MPEKPPECPEEGEAVCPGHVTLQLCRTVMLVIHQTAQIIHHTFCRVFSIFGVDLFIIENGYCTCERKFVLSGWSLILLFKNIFKSEMFLECLV